MDDQEFTIDMADGFRATAKWLFAEFAGQPIRYLEVGIYEGRSGCWMLDNILTNEGACYVGIDAAMGKRDGEAHARCLRNFARYGSKVKVVRGDSSEVLPGMAGQQFDIIYVDGGHAFGQCLQDLRLSWPLLSPGGILLADDYLHPEHEVKAAADAFSTEVGTPVHKDYQIAWRKSR